MSPENPASPDGPRPQPPDRSRPHGASAPNENARSLPGTTAVRSRPGRSLLSVLLLLPLVFSSGCFGKRPSEAPIPTDPALRAAEIAELRAAIERDHATLEAWITRNGLEKADALTPHPSPHENPTLRAIAERLTRRERRLARLESLERERERVEQNDAAPGRSAESTEPVAPQ